MTKLQPLYWHLMKKTLKIIYDGTGLRIARTSDTGHYRMQFLPSKNGHLLHQEGKVLSVRMW